MLSRGEQVQMGHVNIVGLETDEDLDGPLLLQTDFHPTVVTGNFLMRNARLALITSVYPKTKTNLAISDNEIDALRSMRGMAERRFQLPDVLFGINMFGRNAISRARANTVTVSGSTPFKHTGVNRVHPYMRVYAYGRARQRSTLRTVSGNPRAAPMVTLGDEFNSCRADMVNRDMILSRERSGADVDIMKDDEYLFYIGVALKPAVAGNTGTVLLPTPYPVHSAFYIRQARNP